MFSVGRMQICHFRRFCQNGPFLAGDKNTIYQKHGLCTPRWHTNHENSIRTERQQHCMCGSCKLTDDVEQQGARQGALSFRGVAFMTGLAFLAVLESNLLLVLQNTRQRGDPDGFGRDGFPLQLRPHFPTSRE